VRLEGLGQLKNPITSPRRCIQCYREEITLTIKNASVNSKEKCQGMERKHENDVEIRVDDQ
jgi:hypothetical protein